MVSLMKIRREILGLIRDADPPRTEEVAFLRYRVVAGMLQSFPKLTEAKK
jgi:hypothetical protein